MFENWSKYIYQKHTNIATILKCLKKKTNREYKPQNKYFRELVVKKVLN